MQDTSNNQIPMTNNQNNEKIIIVWLLEHWLLVIIWLLFLVSWLLCNNSYYSGPSSAGFPYFYWKTNHFKTKIW